MIFHLFFLFVHLFFIGIQGGELLIKPINDHEQSILDIIPPDVLINSFIPHLDVLSCNSFFSTCKTSQDMYKTFQEDLSKLSDNESKNTKGSRRTTGRSRRNNTN